MTCERIRKLFPDYLMMEADPESTAMVEAHIADCTGCRRELEIAGELWTKLEVVPVELPGENLRNRFYMMLERGMKGEWNKPENKEGFYDRFRHFFLMRRWRVSPAAVLLIVLSGFLAGLFIDGTAPSLNDPYRKKNDRANRVLTETGGQAELIRLFETFDRMRSVDRNPEIGADREKVPPDMKFVEFFPAAAFSLAEYFTRVFTL